MHIIDFKLIRIPFRGLISKIQTAFCRNIRTQESNLGQESLRNIEAVKLNIISQLPPILLNFVNKIRALLSLFGTKPRASRQKSSQPCSWALRQKPHTRTFFRWQSFQTISRAISKYFRVINKFYNQGVIIVQHPDTMGVGMSAALVTVQLTDTIETISTINPKT